MFEKEKHSHRRLSPGHVLCATPNYSHRYSLLQKRVISPAKRDYLTSTDRDFFSRGIEVQRPLVFKYNIVNTINLQSFAKYLKTD